MPSAQQPVRPRHIPAVLLLWALILASAGMLVRLALARIGRRTQAGEPRIRESWPPSAIRHDTGIERLIVRPARGGAGPTDAQIARTGTVGFTSCYGPSSIQDALPLADANYRKRCAAGLRHAGWDTRTRAAESAPGPDVIARNGERVLALRCLPSSEPVDVQEVVDACEVREQQRSDLAAIVSNASFTEGARQLAARTGIVLLHENELSSFAA